MIYRKVVLLATFAIVSAKVVKIDIDVGSLAGEITEAKPSRAKFASFQSIPYAEPPVGKLRFKDPVAKKSWPGVLDATKEVPSCPQLKREETDQLQTAGTTFGSEDCLFLNVYVPVDENGKMPEGLPVMVWIHGGAFCMGDGGPQMYAPDYFMSEKSNQVVLVTLNYRLGILGFLSTDDDVISGNMGLKDQNLALRWVKQNIERFGGDPNNITLFGESAGGMSVMAHILSPWSRGLFSKAIVQSGPFVNSPFLHFAHPTSHYARGVVENMDPDVDADAMSSGEILDFLQAAKLDELVSRTGLYEKFMFVKFPWKPIVDSHSTKPFLPGNPKDLITSGKYNKVPIIIGGTEDEGSLHIVQFMLHEEKFDQVNDDFDVLGPVLLLGVDEDSVTDPDSAAAQLLKKEYLDGLHANFTKENWKRIRAMFTDVHFLSPIHTQTTLMLEQGDHPIFYYNYRHKGGLTLPMMYKGYEKISSYDFGACHADECFVMFRQNALGDKNELIKGGNDPLVIENVIGMWTSFATTGAPHKEWKRLTSDTRNMMAVLNEKPVIMVEDAKFVERMELVEKLVSLAHSYRHFDFKDHPAVREMMNKKHEWEDETDFADSLSNHVEL